MNTQELISDNNFLRDENQRLTQEYNELYDKAERYDLLIKWGLVTKTTLDKLDEAVGL
ncbi:hypothetical protein [Streptococcus thoraltensis]|uniref:hypothetical protein n=1 Tax=Streptococcus thoraltensis TaxID=55085 RepID=UPI00036BC147|nr:hypothetical protein [Streptococcus thoraltensis]QBX31140.1 hypothetical protein Javan616_0047 [Streptococcus phage Javan616]